MKNIHFTQEGTRTAIFCLQELEKNNINISEKIKSMGDEKRILLLSFKDEESDTQIFVEKVRENMYQFVKVLYLNVTFTSYSSTFSLTE